MANLTKTEKYVALTYAKYFGKTATKGIIDDYVSIGKTSKILNQIIKDADIEQFKVHGDDLQAEVHNTFQNLFSRNADNKELQKYVKVLQKGKNLPINSIVKKATKFDKDVYKNKQEIAEFVAKNGGGVFDLSKVTKANPIDVGSLTSLTDLQAKIDALPENDGIPSSFDGKTYTLTTGTDKIVGSDKGDIIEATGTTLTAFDKIDGRAGIDTLQIRDAAGVMGTVNPAGMEIVNVEKMTVETAGSFGQVTATGTVAVAGVKQIDQVSFTTNTSADSYDVIWNGVTLTTAVATGTNNATLVANAINAVAGYTAASVVGTSVVITAPSAGTSQMPSYTITNNDNSANSDGNPAVNPSVVAGVNAVEATGATTAAVYDVSGIADLTDVKVTSAVNVNLKAATTTDVSVSGTTGAIKVDGGKNVNVTDAKAAVTLDNAKGNVTVTDATQTAAISITDGANVTVTTTATATAAINVGTANNTATGDVVVTQNLNSTGAAGLTGGAINVVGGKTVTVDVNSTNSATAGTNAIATGAITVTGDANTTAVTVNQTEAVTGAARVPATAGVTEVASVQFTPLANGATTTLGGLTFTAAKALTAAEVAAAFANLKAGATHGQAKADNGIYTGTFSGEFTSGSVSADNKVVFTAIEAGVSTVFTTGGSVTVTTKGVDAKEAKAAVGAITNGVVTIADGAGATDTIKTVTVDGYAGGSSITSNVLTDVTLKNSAAGATTMTLTSTVASLNVTLDDINGTVDLDGTLPGVTTLKTLNLTTTGEASDIILDAQAVETLTIAAGADLTTDGSALTALKTVTISGTGDVALGDISGATTTALTSTTTGDVSAIVDGTRATVTTGAGNDTITVNSTTTVTKTISLGAGDDKLILSGITSVNVDTAAISGGEGTDTIVLTAANAATLSSLANSIIFKSKVTGFEKLDIGAAGGITNVNVGNLGFNYVVTNANTALLTLADMANNGTVELNGASTGGTTVLVKDASLVTSTADVLNVIANVANAGVNNGALTAANVETINITATDSTPIDDNELSPTFGDATINESTLALVATSAKTVTITGNAHLDLDMTGNTAATLIDASTLTGNLTVTSYNTTTSATIKGGLGNDDITAANLDKVFGGAGNDTITAASFAELTGGTGADTFVAKTATSSTTVNTNTFATIKDFNKAEGDSIKFAGATDFNNTKVDALATFDATLAAAASAAGNKGVSWFTFTDNATQSTDTYLVYNNANDATFDLDADTVIKIAGVVDFSTAAFNGTDDTIAFA